MAVEKVEHVKTDCYSLPFKFLRNISMSPDDDFTDFPLSHNREAFDRPKMKTRKSSSVIRIRIPSGDIIEMGKGKLQQKENGKKNENVKPKDDAECLKARDDSDIVEYPELTRPLDRPTLHVSKITCVPITDRDDQKLVYIKLENPGDYSRAKTLEGGVKCLMISEVFNPVSRVPPELVLIPALPVPPVLPEPVLISAPPDPPILVSIPVLPPHSRKETFMEICQCMSHVGFFLLGVSSVYAAAWFRSGVKKWTDSGCPALVTSTSSIEVPVHLPGLPNFKLPKLFDLFEWFEVWKKWIS